MIATKPLAIALAASLLWGASAEWRARGLRAELAEGRAAVAQEDLRRSEAIQEVTRYANQARARVDDNRRAVDDAAARLRERYAALVRQVAYAATGGEASACACDLQSELLGAADERLRGLAAEADAARAAGDACVRAYDALTPTEAPRSTAQH